MKRDETATTTPTTTTTHGNFSASIKRFALTGKGTLRVAASARNCPPLWRRLLLLQSVSSNH